MTEQTNTIFERLKKSEIKFDYFICSVAGALFAYIAQTYTPQKLDNAFSIFQTIALLLLAASFFCGIRRLQLTNRVLRLNHAIYHSSDIAKGITQNLREGRTIPFYEFEHQTSGEKITPQSLELKRDNLLKEISKYEKQVLYDQKMARLHGWIQVNFLFLGFLLIFSAKVLQPYQSDFSRHAASINQIMNTPAQPLAESQTNKPAHP